jgi:hypothetical protein
MPVWFGPVRLFSFVGIGFDKVVEWSVQFSSKNRGACCLHPKHDRQMTTLHQRTTTNSPAKYGTKSHHFFQNPSKTLQTQNS